MLAQFGTLNGRVVDARSHAAIPFASVELWHLQAPLDREYTDVDGRFHFQYLGAGVYTILVDREGYERSSVEVPTSEITFPVTVELIPKKAPSTKAAVTSLRDYLVPKGARKEFDRARSEAKQQNCSKAIDHFEQGLRIFGQDASAYNDLGNCYRKIEQFERAEDSFKRARALSDSIYVSLNLAEVYTAQNRFKDAESVLLETIQRKPNAGDAYYGLALVYLQEGRSADAEAVALEAGRHPHQIADLHLVLAQIHSDKGDSAGAVEQLQKYLKEAPSGTQSARVRELLNGALRPNE